MHPFVTVSIITFAIFLPSAAFVGFLVERKKEDPDIFQGAFKGLLVGAAFSCAIVTFFAVTCAFCY